MSAPRKLSKDHMSLGIGWDPEIDHEDKHWFCKFGVHWLLAPIMQLDETGCVYEHFGPVATSIAVFLEQEALHDEVALKENWHGRDIPFLKQDAAKVSASLQRLGLALIKEASDEYSGWWTGKNGMAWLGMFWGNFYSPTRHINIYSPTQDDLDTILHALADVGVRPESQR